jgi:hypothetical protein
MTILDAITTSLCEIEPEQIRHPYLGFQERVVCYELYHQLRLLEQQNRLAIRPARFQAELNKTGQAYFQHIVGEAFRAIGEELGWRVPEAMPDLLAHEPGTDSNNLAVLEAKRSSAGRQEIEWDLAKLAMFSSAPLAYKNRVFLYINEGFASQDELIREIQSHSIPAGTRIDLAVYSPEEKAVIWDEVTYSRDAAIKLFEGVVLAREAKRKRK